MSKNISAAFYLFTIILIMFGCSPSEQKGAQYELRAGNLDIRNQQLDKIGPIYLDGEWRFYWQRLSTDPTASDEISPIFVPVPDSWSNYREIDKSVEQYGYATYQMNIHVNEKDIGCIW